MANVAEFNIDFTDLKVLNDYLNKTTDKVELMASSAKKDFNRLKMAIDPVARAQKMFKDQVLVAQKALATNSISNKQYAETFKMIQANAAKAGVQLNQFGQVASVNTRSMKKFGAVGMQQVGYQVQDFAVQVQGGTSAMVALGQQGSQLLGIFGPAGAIAGMILAIGTGLVGAFNAARSSSASAISKFESFTGAMKAMKEEIEDLTLKNYMFNVGIENTSLALKKLALGAIEANMAAYEAMSTFEKMFSNLKNRIKYALSGELEDQAETLRTEADKLQALLDEFKKNEAATEAAKELERLEEARGELLQSYLDEYDGLLKLQGLKDRALFVAKQQVALDKELNKLKRQEGLSDQDVSLMYQVIVARQQEALAIYDITQAEKLLEDQKKQNDINARNREIARRKAHKQALEDYADVLAASKSIGSSMESAMMSMVDGTKTVSAAFKSMASEIIKDLYRIYVVKKITGMITGAIDGYFAPNVAATAAVPGVANGGPVQYGNSYLVGERGPEIFTPGMGGGQITSNSKSGIGSGVTIVQNINVSTGVQQTVRAEIRQMMPQIANSAKAAVVDAKRRGGSYGKAFA